MRNEIARLSRERAEIMKDINKYNAQAQKTYKTWHD